jgi:hypothetical protein
MMSAGIGDELVPSHSLHTLVAFERNFDQILSVNKMSLYWTERYSIGATKIDRRICKARRRQKRDKMLLLVEMMSAGIGDELFASPSWVLILLRRIRGFA